MANNMHQYNNIYNAVTRIFFSILFLYIESMNRMQGMISSKCNILDIDNNIGPKIWSSTNIDTYPISSSRIT